MVLLNLDAGEYPDEPEDLWALADIVSIACGGHAGDEASMTRVVAFCAANPRPRIGAHPAYPDREHFGRRTLNIDPDSLLAAVVAQCSTLATIAAAYGRRIEYVKPHGALYHDATHHDGIARAVVQGVREALGSDVMIIGPERGQLRDAASGLGYVREGFADRAVRPDGTLVPRTEPDALITDPRLAASRARELAGQVDTICVHADTPGALEIARAVRAALDAVDG